MVNGIQGVCGVVLRTHYQPAGWSSAQWTMTVQTDGGDRMVLKASFSDIDTLSQLVVVGDRVAFVSEDKEYVDAAGVVILPRQ